MTGTYPLVHRVLCHQNHAPQNLKQLAEILSDSGYRCIGAGHYEADRSLDRGWSDQIPMCGTAELSSALKSQYLAGSKEIGWSAGEHALSPDKAHAATLNDSLIKLLDGIDPDAAPLFLHVAYIEPHAPYFAPKGTMDLSRMKHLPLPKRSSPAERPAWHAEALENFRSMDAGEDDIRRMLEAYYALTEYVDSQLDRLTAYLERRGILDNAWVIVTSDHGDYAGEKGFFTKSETPYECLLRVPMVIRGPKGEWNCCMRINHLVELVDIFPTILGLANLPIPMQSQGADLVEWIDHGANNPIREATFAAVGEYEGPLKTTMPWGLPEAGRHPGLVRGARNHRFSYVRDPDYGDEAYDLSADPRELANLLNNAKPSAEIRSLMKMMDDWEKACQELSGKLGIVEGDRNFGQLPPADLVG